MNLLKEAERALAIIHVTKYGVAVGTAETRCGVMTDYRHSADFHMDATCPECLRRCAEKVW